MAFNILTKSSNLIKFCWEGEVSGCEGEVSGCEGEVSGCEGEVNGCEGEVSGCEGEVNGCEGEVSGCEGEVNDCKGNCEGGREEGEVNGCEEEGEGGCEKEEGEVKESGGGVKSGVERFFLFSSTFMILVIFRFEFLVMATSFFEWRGIKEKFSLRMGE